MQSITNTEQVIFAMADRYCLLLLGYRRQFEVYPFFRGAQQRANEVIVMKPLHYNNYDAVLRVIQARQKRVVVPIVDIYRAGCSKKRPRASVDHQ